MDKTEFYGVRRPLPEYHAIAFEHPVFTAPIRLVANQFAEVTLGGDVYIPAPMTVQPPERRGDANPKLTLSFPRAVVGRAFKQQLALIREVANAEPIRVRYDVYLGDRVTPEITWRLYVSDAGGVVFGAESVSVSAVDDNPMRRGVGLIYTPETFTGLEQL